MAVLGAEPFYADVLATAGLDVRLSARGSLKAAEQLMAVAVGAEHAFFSTCGSSLFAKAAMLAVAGTEGDLIIGRDAHTSVVRLAFSGLQPRWAKPLGAWPPDRSPPYPPGIPVVVLGERLNAQVLGYLRGLAAGMVLPDPTDPNSTRSESTELPESRNARAWLPRASLSRRLGKDCSAGIWGRPPRHIRLS
ncbi:MAG: ornithine decarboxylase [Frankiales bacterium]|nr:ornithine decarboxylase [Frankiales bacterium]